MAGCCDKCPVIYENTHGEQWSRGIGSRKHTLEVCFDANDHKDGTKLVLARLLPNMMFDDIKVRTKGIEGVTVDLGFSDTCGGCCGDDDSIEDLTWFAEGLDVGEAKECLLEGGPWDAASGHCGPPCCDQLPVGDDCPDESKPGPTCAWDLILTVHGEPKDCACLALTFDYQNK